jgi:hypothetical protein
MSLSHFVSRLFPTKLLMLTAIIGGGFQWAVGQDFSISSTPFTPSTVTSGGSATATITVTPSSGFTNSVALSASCPTGVTCTLSPTSVTPTANGSGVTSTLTAVPTSTGPVSSVVTVTGTAGALSHTTPSVTLAQSTANNTTTLSASDNLKNNFGFGLALGLSTNVTGPDIVNNGTVDANGIVRVNTRANTTAGFMLETHYYVFPRVTDDMLSGAKPDNRSWGIGPFVAAQPGSSQIIQAVGAGVMLGFRKPKGSIPSGFGIGIGYEAIPAAQVLGSEFVPGKPAPLGPTGASLPIRYETQDKGSMLIVLSATF